MEGLLPWVTVTDTQKMAESQQQAKSLVADVSPVAPVLRAAFLTSRPAGAAERSHRGDAHRSRGA